MAREKGFKLSNEQKKKMQEGRIAARIKRHEGMIDTEEAAPKKIKGGVKIIGYSFDPGDASPYPIFESEKGLAKPNRIFKTVEEAREVMG